MFKTLTISGALTALGIILALFGAFVDARSIAETVGSAASDRDVGDGIPFNVYEGHHSHSARGDSDLDPVKQWPTKGKYLRFEELALESPESWNCTGGRVGKDHADGFEEAINWLSGFTGVPRGLEPDEQQRGQSSKPVSCGGGVGIYWNNNTRYKRVSLESWNMILEAAKWIHKKCPDRAQGIVWMKPRGDWSVVVQSDDCSEW